MEGKRKIIVSNRKALQRKYGEWEEKIESIFDVILRSDENKGLNACLVMVDDKQQMKKYRGPAVDNVRDEKKNKQAIDAAVKFNRADYVTIFGGPDVIPFQTLKNPAAGAGEIKTDLPYACNSSYDKDLSFFLNPERMVSRLPDLYAGVDQSLKFQERGSTLIRQMIIKIAGIPVREAAEYDACFGMVSGEKGSLHSDYKKLIQCPPVPDDGDWDMSLLTHYFDLYGNSGDCALYCDKGLKNPAYGFHYPMDNENVYPIRRKEMRIKGGTFVINYSSFGAQLNSCNGYMPLALVYLLNGAGVYLGNYTAVKRNAQDLEIVKTFYEEARKGKTTGEAYLHALLEVQKNAAQNPEAAAAMAEWAIFGDSSAQLMKANE